MFIILIILNIIITGILIISHISYNSDRQIEKELKDTKEDWKRRYLEMKSKYRNMKFKYEQSEEFKMVAIKKEFSENKKEYDFYQVDVTNKFSGLHKPPKRIQKWQEEE